MNDEDMTPETATDRLAIQVADTILKRGLDRTPVYLLAILELAMRVDDLEEAVAALIEAERHRDKGKVEKPAETPNG